VCTCTHAWAPRTQGAGITVTFSFAKPSPANPAVTELTATYASAHAGPVTDFNLQASQASRAYI
jgi:hypothetical protein